MASVAVLRVCRGAVEEAGDGAHRDFPCGCG